MTWSLPYFFGIRAGPLVQGIDWKEQRVGITVLRFTFHCTCGPASCSCNRHKKPRCAEASEAVLSEQYLKRDTLNKAKRVGVIPKLQVLMCMGSGKGKSVYVFALTGRVGLKKLYINYYISKKITGGVKRCLFPVAEGNEASLIRQNKFRQVFRPIKVFTTPGRWKTSKNDAYRRKP